MNQLPSSSNKDLPYNALEDSPLAKQFEGLPSLHSLRIEYSGLQSQESETTTWPSLPLEIWKVVGGKIQHPGTLKALVRVSRAFREIFTPALYSCRVINLERFAKSLKDPSLPPFLEHVKDFRVNLCEFGSDDTESSGGIKYEIGMNEDFVLLLTRALEPMRALRSFRWINQAFAPRYDPALILRSPAFLHALQSKPTLQRISIQFSVRRLRNPRDARKCSFPLKGFQNLSSLELYNFYGNQGRLIKDIARVLGKSPQLKMLGLGMASEWVYGGALILDGEGEPDRFLERLCEFYASEMKRPPLALETLRLGHGMYVYETTDFKGESSISKLVSIRSLRTLHIFNGLVKHTRGDEDFFQDVDWTSFTSECTVLCQLSVTRLEADVAHWLRHGGSSVRELIVTDHYRINDCGLKQFSRIAPGQLEMISTCEVYERAPRPADDEWLTTSDEWSDEEFVGSEISNLESEPSESASGDELSCEDISDPKIYNSRRTLGKSAMTVLDLLRDGGASLTRLAICFVFEEQWEHFTTHLVKLCHLTQLSFKPKSSQRGSYPSRAASLWPGIERPVEIARRYAELISTMCPTLRFIKISFWAWEIHRTGGASLVYLRRLDQDEQLAIELFSITPFAEQCGLPGPIMENEKKRDKKKYTSTYEERQPSTCGPS